MVRLRGLSLPPHRWFISASDGHISQPAATGDGEGLPEPLAPKQTRRRDTQNILTPREAKKDDKLPGNDWWVKKKKKGKFG